MSSCSKNWFFNSIDFYRTTSSRKKYLLAFRIKRFFNSIEFNRCLYEKLFAQKIGSSIVLTFTGQLLPEKNTFRIF